LAILIFTIHPSCTATAAVFPFCEAYELVSSTPWGPWRECITIHWKAQGHLLHKGIAFLESLAGIVTGTWASNWYQPPLRATDRIFGVWNRIPPTPHLAARDERDSCQKASV